MFMNTLLALYFSVVFMVALLAIIGPLTHACDIYHVLKTCKSKLCLVVWKKISARRKVVKKGTIFPVGPKSKSVEEIQEEAEHHKNAQIAHPLTMN